MTETKKAIMFNIRVYGILTNSKGEVLLTDERRHGKYFTKFPGGGVEFGEGTKDALIREFKEELTISIEVKELIYLTDFFQISVFDSNKQIISAYYKVTTKEINKIVTSKKQFDFKNNSDLEAPRWKKISQLIPEDLTFPSDKIVATKIK